MDITKKDINPLSTLKSYSIAFSFIMVMVAVAYYLGDHEIILPEIVALAIGLWVYREAEWIRQPDKIFIAPSLTAIIGFAINHLNIPYVVKLMCIMLVMILVMRLINFSLAPSLATGFLPIVTNAVHYSFIASILLTTFILMMGVMIWKINKGLIRTTTLNYPSMYAYIAITTLAMSAALLMGYPQFAVIPPITVVVYESLNMKMYNRKIALKQTAVLTLSATIGVSIFLQIDNWIGAALINLCLMYLLLRLFKMHVPAVYAFPFLAYVLPRETLYLLPQAALISAFVSLGLVLAYRSYVKKKPEISKGKECI
jgi:hypothetical protein